MQPTFVFVHGTFSNSFAWSPLQRELALRGHRTLAVDLPGHGFDAAFWAAYQAPQDPAALATAPARVAGVTVADNAAHVVAAVRRVAEHGPVVLVGHSGGGLTIGQVAAAVPELVSRLVYISAWCPVAASVAEYHSSSEYATSKLNETAALLAGDPAALGVIRLNWRTADPVLLATLKEALCPEATDAEFLGYLNTLEPDESLALSADTSRVDPAVLARLPHSYIRLTRDRSIPLVLQDRLIEEADARVPENPFDVHSLDSGHAGFLIRPAEAAALLDRLAPRG
ncbi:MULTISPECIES: alpha/beta hydrolase [Streptomycetaceae]|uniref:Esterase n=1 Tax=Streptantibioticus cattleyicolor (strain ATCC 35852 / DSM 46488 / JCM 4925 / NBRC 14057 / NRRL 8057) TaxID=1003195 RepID=F8JQH8_STREN|nr:MULTISPECIES: alpha/beta hydrolase [Streptomycetaceae]AEW97821.1 esterase [Streptantibioticus cattleyicolor NRRL 8057 = DSM 46488]MYS62236.1 alpha/beta fold hydrolase [Streptomyces sp. SID5468]CCB78139.1 Esterase [Streptantibioticus cattleyicolor NRRL 8057 = DSM 46488]